MKYTFYYYHNDMLVYVGNCVDIDKLKARHNMECNFGYAKNGYDACFYKYLKDNNIKYEDLCFKSENAILSTSEEVIKRYNPVCNNKLDLSSLTCVTDCYIYRYMYEGCLIYMKLTFDVDGEHKRHMDNFDKNKCNIYLYDYMRSKNITFNDLILSYEKINEKISNITELYDIEDKYVMDYLPICNTGLNCVRSKKDMFKELHEDLLSVDKDDTISRFKRLMMRKLLDVRV